MTHHYTILHGGTVLTLEGGWPTDAASRLRSGDRIIDAAGARATAVCIAGGTILAIGADAEVLSLAGADSTVVDLRGRAIVPGFIDPHAHPYGEGLSAAQPSVEGAPDLRAAMRSLPSAAEHLDPDAWLVARYNHVRWPEGRHPTRDDLDRAVPDRPVLLSHASGHAVAANSLALALAGITAATPDRPGEAVLLRDLSGEPTGVIEGTEAWAMLAVAMPPPDESRRDLAMRMAAARLAADGVTWASDADLGSVVSLDHELAAYADALARGSFPLGVSLMPGQTRLAPDPGDDPVRPEEILAAFPVGLLDRVRALHVKMKADGAMTTRTAWLAAPYEDAPDSTGRRVHDPSALAERIRRSALAGWGVATHAIGDAAVAAVLDACAESAAAEVPAAAAAGVATDHPQRRAPHRIEHGMILPPALLARVAASGLRVVAQPEFTAWAGDVYRRRLGEVRASHIYPYSAMLAAGIPIAFSSDRPVVPGAPLVGIRAAVRHDPDISVAECLHAWTAGAAAAAGADESGVLSVGRRADLAVLSADPTTVARDSWARGEDGVAVEATFAGGRIVFGMLDGLERHAGDRIDASHVPGRRSRR